MPHTHLALVLAAVAASPLQAQLNPPTLSFARSDEPVAAPPPTDLARPAMPPQGPPPISFFFSTDATIGFKSDLKDNRGDASVTRVNPEVGLFARIGERGALIATLSFEYSSYDFNGPTNLTPIDNSPWEDVFNERLSLIYRYQATERWEYIVGGNIGLSHADGADLAKSVTGGVILGGNYTLNDNLKLGLAVGVFTRLEDDPLVVPVPVVEYTIRPGLKISNENRPGVFVTYEANESWSLMGGLSFAFRDFRLAKNGPVPGGVGRDDRFPVELMATYSPSRRFSLQFGGGVDLNVSYRLDDNNGNRFTSAGSDIAPFVKLGGTIRF